MTTTKKELDPFSCLLFDIAAHVNPKLLKDSDQFIAPANTFDFKKLEEYRGLVSSVDFASKKTAKYGLYFSEFYPVSDKIPPYEALEHHVHSYLEDLDILENKLVTFLTTLKNDLKRVHPDDKPQITTEFEAIVKKISRAFNSVSEFRNPHHHKGSRYMDSDLLDSQFAATMLGWSHTFNDLITDDGKEYFKKQEVESFEKAKKIRIKQAEENSEKITKLLNWLFNSLDRTIYEFLGIKHSAKLIGAKQKTK